ncbi:hypothetical protein NM3158_1877 [Neisseria meningitidis NM3158]|nr:hypothetical protein NM3158_1877 [Neisseria meningitidis NM3158]
MASGEGLKTKNFRGCTRLALNPTPIPQDFKLLRRCAEVKSKFAFFQEQRERFTIDSVVFSQDAFCLIPKVLNAVNVVLTVCKLLGMVDAVMDKTAHVQLVAAAQTIGINNLSGMIFFLMTGSNVSDLALSTTTV